MSDTQWPAELQPLITRHPSTMDHVALLFVPRVTPTVATDLITDTAWYYVVRLVAFALIVVAVIGTNRSTGAG